jgi:hypothetical protein
MGWVGGMAGRRLVARLCRSEYHMWILVIITTGQPRRGPRGPKAA